MTTTTMTMTMTTFPLFSKIATKAFLDREAGVFKAPSPVVREVSEIAVAAYAANVWAAQKEKIHLHNEKIKYYHQNKTRLETGLMGVRDAVNFRHKRGGDYKTLHFFRRDLDLKFLLESREEGTVFFIAFREGSSSQDINQKGPFTYDEVLREIDRIYSKHKKELTRKLEDLQAVEYYQMINEIKKYTKKPFDYEKETIEKKLKISTENWDIIDRLLESTRKNLEATQNKMKEAQNNLVNNLNELEEEGDHFSLRVVAKSNLGISLVETENVRFDVTKTGALTYHVKESQEEASEMTREEVLELINYRLKLALEDIETGIKQTDREGVHKKMGYLGLDVLTLRLIFDPRQMENAGGRFYKDLMKIDLKMSHKVMDKKSFQDNVHNLISVIEHECQHLGQYLITRLRELDPNTNPAGFSEKLDKGENWSGIVDNNTKKDHALRGVEFYPRLTDEVDAFVRKVKNIPQKYRKPSALLWVGALGRDQKETLQKDYLDHFVWGDQIKTKEFFELLKENEPEKWKKAVKEFLKEVEAYIN